MRTFSFRQCLNHVPIWKAEQVVCETKTVRRFKKKHEWNELSGTKTARRFKKKHEEKHGECLKQIHPKYKFLEICEQSQPKQREDSKVLILWKKNAWKKL